MLKRSLILFSLISLAFLVGCTNHKITTEPDAVSSGYFESIKSLYLSYPSITSSSTILAFDFSNLDFEGLDTLKDLVKEFTEEEGYTYLEATMADLIELGYIEFSDSMNEIPMPLGFSNGVLFEITPVSVEENRLVTELSMWKGNLSAFGSTFTAVYSNGAWVISTNTVWVS
ncbi:MAG: hypothetical protein KKE16_07035 [Firmicutes bacterium]|nr:hypothetical protein [Bacillota bacterium]